MELINLLVSVIIPSYNHEKFIRQAAQSVLNQTHSHLELIVIDDGSTDKSLSILDELDDARMLVITQHNQGAHAAINHGLELAQGDYLAILNSDDVYYPTRISQLVDAVNQSGADFVSSWIEIIDADGRARGIKQGWENLLPSWCRGSSGEPLLSQNPFASNLLISNFISTTSNMLLRRTVYESIGGMHNLRFSHDWDYALRIASEFECEMVREPLLKYRLHSTNTIRSNHEWMMLETCWVLAANIDRFGQLLYGHSDDDLDQLTTISKIGANLVPKGCDRLFWILKHYIDWCRRHGRPGSEFLAISDQNFRDTVAEFLE
jgi:glycosyltransferase involved in cell wall biosynthesis